MGTFNSDNFIFISGIEPFRCLVKEDDDRGDKILETTGRKECKKYKGSDVCLEIYQQKDDGINACHMTIKKMKQDHESN